MEKHHLEYIVETARQQSITKAAEVIMISQPSLSQQIINVENELGIKLFERNKKKVIPTEACRTFVHIAEKILNGFDELQETMRQYADKKRGRLKLGILPLMVPLGMVDVTVEFMNKYPGFDVTLSEQGSNDLMQRIKQNDLDAAILTLSEENKPTDVKMIKIMESKVMAVVPSENKLARKNYITINDLCNEKLIIQTDSFNIQRLILNRMEEHGIESKIFFSCNQIETCFILVSKGFGISFCSEAIMHNVKYDNLVYVPMKGIESRKIYLAYSRDPNYHPALKVFVNFIMNYYSLKIEE